MELKELERALETRDAETLKRLAAIDLKADKAANDGAAVKIMLSDIEQKMARRPGGGDGAGKSAGQQFIDSAAFKGFDAGSARKSADLTIKATITSLTTDAAGSAGGAAIVSRDGEAVTLAQRRMRVRDLMPVIPVTGGSVEVLIQKSRNLNAGMVAEGNAKPGSDVQMVLETFPVRTIAHYMKASRQIADDAPQLAGVIDSELLFGLALVEEAQLLLGDGTGQNLEGMVPQATPFVAPFELEDATMIDTIGLAMLQNALAEYPADGVVMHPSDWMRIRMTKDDDGNYIYGPPGGVEPIPRIFGAPVVPTQAMTIDKFLVGEFQRAATIYDRWAARIEVATQNEDDFIKNLLAILGEERLAFAVKRPLALTYGDFGNV